MSRPLLSPIDCRNNSQYDRELPLRAPSSRLPQLFAPPPELFCGPDLPACVPGPQPLRFRVTWSPPPQNPECCFLGGVKARKSTWVAPPTLLLHPYVDQCNGTQLVCRWRSNYFITHQIEWYDDPQACAGTQPPPFGTFFSRSAVYSFAVLVLAINRYFAFGIGSPIESNIFFTGTGQRRPTTSCSDPWSCYNMVGWTSCELYGFAAPQGAMFEAVP